MIRNRQAVLFALFTLLISAQAPAAPAVFGGHTYDFIPGNVSYSTAKSNAGAMQINGVFGHLATITSQAENDFIFNTFSLGVPGQFAWIGGTDNANENIWLWDDGPEDGVQFSLDEVPVGPLNYANWGGDEPNDFGAGEDYALINLGTVLDGAGIEPGEWGDGADIVSSLFVGYIVEFETALVPIPAALLLFGSAIAGLPFFRRHGTSRS